MTNETKGENIVYLDIETQYLMTDFPGGWKNDENYKKIKIAVLGTLCNDKYRTFGEKDIDKLDEELQSADLVVGHNIMKFDYTVLKHYVPKEYIEPLRKKSFDTMLEFSKFTGNSSWVSLDDLATRNFGMAKTHDSATIPKMWRDGHHDEVKSYLLNDLKMTEAVYLHGKKGGKFKFEYKNYGESFGEREVFIKW